MRDLGSGMFVDLINTDQIHLLMEGARMSPLKRMSGSFSAKLLRAVLNLAAPALGSLACSSTLYTSLKCRMVMDGARKPLWTAVASPLAVVAEDSADTMIAVADGGAFLLLLAAGAPCKARMAINLLFHGWMMTRLHHLYVYRTGGGSRGGTWSRLPSPPK